ncbi:MAG: erythromycin esterase family protein, partial [Myxococcales bacterium]|nr:erythromycin esterase family protein [Myxococcales bacterium]
LALLAFSYRTAMAWAQTSGDSSPSGLRRYRDMFIARERHMDAELSTWRATLPADARVVVLGHNLHLARRSERLRFGRAPHDLEMWPSLGTLLDRAEPGSTYVVWLLYERGTRLAPQPSGGCEARVETAADHLEHAIAGDRPVFLPLDRAPSGSVVDRPIAFGTETSEGSGPIRPSVDAVVILPEASAAGPRP